MRTLTLAASLALLPLSGVALADAPAGSPTTPAPAAAAPNAEAAKVAAERMQKFYEQTQDLHARFEQELSGAFGDKKTASGELWLKKGGKMRWEYAKPERKYMIADGEKLWVYEPEDQQAFQQSLKSSSLPSSVSFLFGKGRLGEEFSFELDALPEGAVAEPGDLVLKLVPKQGSAQLRYLDFLLDGKSYMVKESWLWDQQGGVNRIRFAGVETNKGVPDGKFKFSPPPGTQIIRP